MVVSKIIHIDADCFFAAVEERNNPALRGLPVAVGGDPGRRGVVATCNYQARRFGVRSAMPSAHAKRLCPDLIILKPDMAKYRVVSNQMHKIFAEYTSCIEPLSLDEAFLDVTHSESCSNSATLMANEIQQRISKEIGVTVSAGAAQAKFLAKIASDWNKPNGLFVIAPGQEKAFAARLSVATLPGVGPVMRDKLARYGIVHCSDVLDWGLAQAVSTLGSFGERLHSMSLGLDDRPVVNRVEKKCISVESTFDEDVVTPRGLKYRIPALIERLKARVPGNARFSGQFVKMKFSNFSLRTMETRLLCSAEAVSAASFELMLNAMWHRERLPVRLIGVGLKYAQPESEKQLLLPL